MSIPFETIRWLDVFVFHECIPSELLSMYGWTKQEYENRILLQVDEEFKLLLRAKELCLN